MDKSPISRKKVLAIILAFVLLYGASTGISYALFSFLGGGIRGITSPIADLRDQTTTDEQGPKDRACPLNGAYFTRGQEEKWQERRPLAVMVENHVDTRPQSGLSRADLLYEAVAEGGITRFMAVFLCQDAGDVAPVRSARTYHLDWLSEYDAAYAHVGGANTPGPANALGQVRQYQIKDMDQFGLGFPTYWRGADRFAPHNVHTTTKKLWEAAASRGWKAEDEETKKRWDGSFVPWVFKNEADLGARPVSFEATVEFWASQPAYTVTWKYDQSSNTFKRFHGVSPHMDQLTNEQLSAKVVVIQFMDESTADDGYPGDLHLLYKTKGKGEALIFQDGKVVKAAWQKKDRLSRTKYFDEGGREITFNRGQIWIQTVPTGANVKY